MKEGSVLRLPKDIPAPEFGKRFWTVLFSALIAIACITLNSGCSLAERKALLGDTGQYVGISPRDVDPLVDSDGNGISTDDIDNQGEILGGLVAYLLRNPTPVGLGVAGSGLAVFLLTRYFRRRQAPKIEDDEDAETS